jgi:hypothetical protein
LAIEAGSLALRALVFDPLAANALALDALALDAGVLSAGALSASALLVFLATLPASARTAPGLDMTGAGPLVVASLGDSRDQGYGAAQRETGDRNSNELVHDVLHTHRSTEDPGPSMSPPGVTRA